MREVIGIVPSEDDDGIKVELVDGFKVILRNSETDEVLLYLESSEILPLAGLLNKAHNEIFC